jgi:iron complex outermembrane receptor protein
MSTEAGANNSQREASSGIVNLITKEPLPTTHIVFSLQVDRFGAVPPTFDVTGPIGRSEKLFYRLNAEFADTSTFRDYFRDSPLLSRPGVLGLESQFASPPAPDD